MRVITLIPMSKRGKQIIKQHGDRWEVQRQEPKVQFSDDVGPWLFCIPLSEERGLPNNFYEAKQLQDTASRWVHEFFDNNFKVAP